MSPTLQLHLLGLLSQLFPLLHYSGEKFSASRPPFARLTAEPFVTLCSCDDEGADGGFIWLRQPIYCAHLLSLFLLEYEK